jgi:hypothetical protein
MMTTVMSANDLILNHMQIPLFSPKSALLLLVRCAGRKRGEEQKQTESGRLSRVRGETQLRDWTEKAGWTDSLKSAPGRNLSPTTIRL